ncbi:hypothetical protein CMI37_32455 [Candidatus Pacearchaeota archaeon]|nr:hypothetical protein [Candidatus Pacearchaeota archaeon]
MNSETEPRIDVRVESVHTPDKVKDGGSTYKVKVINEAYHVWERFFHNDKLVDPPTMEVIRKDFFLNRQAYTHIGTVGEMNMNSVRQNAITQPPAMPPQAAAQDDTLKDAQFIRPVGEHGNPNPT